MVDMIFYSTAKL